LRSEYRRSPILLAFLTSVPKTITGKIRTSIRERRAKEQGSADTRRLRSARSSTHLVSEKD
jgi:hypothetical protein